MNLDIIYEVSKKNDSNPDSEFDYRGILLSLDIINNKDIKNYTDKIWS